MALARCSSCRGFVAPSSGRCPNCRTTLRRVAATAFAALAGGSVAVTLMACYGCPDGDCGSALQYCPNTREYVDDDASCPDASPDHDVPDVAVHDAATDAPDDAALDATGDAPDDAADDAPSDAGSD